MSHGDTRNKPRTWLSRGLIGRDCGRRKGTWAEAQTYPKTSAVHEERDTEQSSTRPGRKRKVVGEVLHSRAAQEAEGKQIEASIDGNSRLIDNILFARYEAI